MTLNSPISEAGARFGDHMDTIGDIDGDGVNDFAVSSPLASDGRRPHVGRVWDVNGDGVPDMAIGASSLDVDQTTNPATGNFSPSARRTPSAA